TMQMLSCMCQPLPSEESSDEMWGTCATDWMNRVEMRRSKVPLLGAMRCWSAQRPRWGWVAASGAFVVVGSAWMLGPTVAPSDSADLFALPSDLPDTGGPVRFLGEPRGGFSNLFPYSTETHRREFTAPPGTRFEPFASRVSSDQIGGELIIPP